MKLIRSIVCVFVLLAMIPLSFSRILDSMGQSSVITLDVVLIPFELLFAIAICIFSFFSSSKIVVASALFVVFVVVDLVLPTVPLGLVMGFGPHYYKLVPSPEVSFLLSKSYVLSFCAVLISLVFVVSKTKAKA